MKALVIADTDPEIDITQVVAYNHVDVVITLGDLLTSDLTGLENVAVPKLGVYGNHDINKYMPQYGICNLHGNQIELGGLRFVGIEGCPEYRQHSDSEPMHRQEEATKLINQLPPADVVITHCPPRGINDNDDDKTHIGWLPLSDYVAKYQPRVLLHGHVNPQTAPATTMYGDTRIEFTFGYRIIEL